MTDTKVIRNLCNVIAIALCPQCNVIHKVRENEKAENGAYKCRQCGADIQLDKVSNG